MLHDRAIIGDIDVNDLDRSLLENVFSVLPELLDVFHLPKPGEKCVPDVLFVDADNQAAMMKWQKYYQLHKTAIPIMVTSGNKQIGSAMTIQRPFSFKKIVIALKRVSDTSKHKTTAANDASAAQIMRILVVDDSLPVRKYMESKVPQLARGPVDLDFAASGEEAGQKIYHSEIPYDLVFLDVVMPGADGYKVCKWIKSKKPTNVVMLTSKSSPFDRIRGVMSACDAYLTKPPDERQLGKILNKCFKEKLKKAKAG